MGGNTTVNQFNLTRYTLYTTIRARIVVYNVYQNLTHVASLFSAVGRGAHASRAQKGKQRVAKFNCVITNY